jgi:hypothetical protein
MATVYEYKGASYELPDGLSNEEALTKIKASLGGEPTQVSPDLLKSLLRLLKS